MVLPVIAAVARVGGRALGSLRGAKGLSNVRADAARMKRNITKRVQRIEEAGLKNYATEEFQALKNAPLPTTEAQWRAYRSDLVRLNKASGTAIKTAKRAHTLFENDKAKASKVDNPLTRLDMTRGELAEAGKAVKRQLRNQIRIAEKAESNFITEKSRDVLEDMNFSTERKADYSINEALQRLRLPSMSAEGSLEGLQRGVDVWGSEYKKWSKDERGAVWDAMKKIEVLKEVPSDVIVDVLATMSKRELTAMMAEVKFRTEPVTYTKNGVTTTKNVTIADLVLPPDFSEKSRAQLKKNSDDFIAGLKRVSSYSSPTHHFGTPKEVDEAETQFTGWSNSHESPRI